MRLGRYERGLLISTIAGLLWLNSVASVCKVVQHCTLPHLTTWKVASDLAPFEARLIPQTRACGANLSRRRRWLYDSCPSAQRRYLRPRIVYSRAKCSWQSHALRAHLVRLGLSRTCNFRRSDDESRVGCPDPNEFVKSHNQRWGAAISSTIPTRRRHPGV